ncbi:Mpv17 / PMP22 family protein [Toxoplasma gondii ARI]|uniref:Mpv17 / PMP22 family protein n=1 Tax=Toxoplasma gondii ARI TaxID=1074872 RepID=A0A139Y611_TOXGO|nr:Mpv17 / PMP22 family protein [Toxoplasma gondii ARI]
MSLAGWVSRSTPRALTSGNSLRPPSGRWSSVATQPAVLSEKRGLTTGAEAENRRETLRRRRCEQHEVPDASCLSSPRQNPALEAGVSQPTKPSLAPHTRRAAAGAQTTSSVCTSQNASERGDEPRFSLACPRSCPFSRYEDLRSSFGPVGCIRSFASASLVSHKSSQDFCLHASRPWRRCASRRDLCTLFASVKAPSSAPSSLCASCRSSSVPLPAFPPAAFSFSHEPSVDCGDGVRRHPVSASSVTRAMPASGLCASLRFLHSSATLSSCRHGPSEETQAAVCRKENPRGKEARPASVERNSGSGSSCGSSHGTADSASQQRQRQTRSEDSAQGEGPFRRPEEENGGRNASSFRERLKRPIKDREQLKKDIVFNSVAALTIYAISDTTAQKLQQGLRDLAEAAEGERRDEQSRAGLGSVCTPEGDADENCAAFAESVGARKTEGDRRPEDTEMEARGRERGREDRPQMQEAEEAEKEPRNLGGDERKEIARQEKRAERNAGTHPQKNERKNSGNSISFFEEWDWRRTVSISLEGFLLNGLLLTAFYHKLEVVVHDDVLSPPGVSQPPPARTRQQATAFSSPPRHAAPAPSSFSKVRSSSQSCKAHAGAHSSLTARQRNFRLWRQSVYKVLMGQTAFMPIAAVVFLFLAPVFRAGLFYLFPPAGVSRPAAATASLPSFAPTGAELSPPRPSVGAESPLVGLQSGPAPTAVAPGQPRRVNESSTQSSAQECENERGTTETEAAKEAPDLVKEDWFRLACREGILCVQRSFWEVYVASWYVWPVTDVINFRYIPLRYRPLWDTTIDLFWTVYLSVAAYPTGLAIAARFAAERNAECDEEEEVGALVTLFQAIKLLLLDRQ